MRVFTFISNNGEGIAIAQRIVSEGHRVQFYINNPKARGVGDGLIEKHIEPGILVDASGRIDREVFTNLLSPNPDCIVCFGDGIAYGNVSDQYRKLGFPVIGASEWGSRLEFDEKFSKQVMNTTGIEIEDASVKGIKLSTSLWFNGIDIVSVMHSIYDMHLMEGSKGPLATMGCVVWQGSDGTRLFSESIGRLLPLLRKIGYIGQLTIDSVVDESMHHGLGFHTHFECMGLSTLLEMYKGKANDLLYGIATGVIKHMPFKSRLGIGITIAVLPFPLHSTSDRIKITGLNKYNLKHFWGYDVCKANGEYTTSGYGGYISTITARGDEIQGFSPLRDAKRRAMRTISNLKIEGLMYRNDIGCKVEGDRSMIKKWGWL